MIILAVDPGSKNIGLAISDPTGTIANPLVVIVHKSILYDAKAISLIANEKSVELIVIGQSFDEEGRPTIEGRRAYRFAQAIKTQIDIPVVFWDESFTTQDARAIRIKMGANRKKRSGHIDSLAALILLQSYLDHLSIH